MLFRSKYNAVTKPFPEFKRNYEYPVKESIIIWAASPKCILHHIHCTTSANNSNRPAASKTHFFLSLNGLLAGSAIGSPDFGIIASYIVGAAVIFSLSLSLFFFLSLSVLFSARPIENEAVQRPLPREKEYIRARQYRARCALQYIHVYDMYIQNALCIQILCWCIVCPHAKKREISSSVFFFFFCMCLNFFALRCNTVLLCGARHATGKTRVYLASARAPFVI